MPTESDHIGLANRNHAALRFLLSEPAHSEWAVTVAFYKAMHLVEAVFARDRGWHSATHDQRLQSLKNLATYKPIFKPFRTLYNLSRIARYLEDSEGRGYRTFADAMPAADVEDKVVRRLLKTIEDHCLGFLSEAARNALTRVAI